MNIYVLIDTDMNYIYSTHKSLESVFDTLREIMHDTFYEQFIMSEDEHHDDSWRVVFPHDNANCVGHFLLVRTELRE